MDIFTVGSYNDLNPETKSMIDSAEPLANDSSSIAVKYQEATRFIAESSQLYLLFDWNFHQLTDGIRITENDILLSADGKTGELDYRITVNGYTINLVSSGINFIQALEAFPNHIEADKQNHFDSFHSFRSCKFDQDVLYALFYSMRNFAQHQQLLVSIHRDNDEYRACFDLDQLSNPILYSMKSKESGTLQKLKEMVAAYSASPPRLGYCYSIDRFNLTVRSIYNAFLNSLAQYAEDLRNEMKRSFFLHPKAFFSLPNGERAAVYYSENACHILTNLEHDPVDAIHNQQSDLDEQIKRAEAQLSVYTFRRDK